MLLLKSRLPEVLVTPSMKFPDYIACVSAYVDAPNLSPDEIVMRSVSIFNPKKNKLVVARYFNLKSDYTDDEACEEIDAIVGDFKKDGNIVDLFFSETPYPMVMDAAGKYMIQVVNTQDYIRIINEKKKQR